MADPISWIAVKAAEWVGMQAFQLATAAGLGVNTAATIANIAYFATQGLVYAGSFAASAALMRPRLPSAEQGSVPLNQSTPLRRLGTGRCRVSGPRLLWESIPGWNIEIIAVNDQPVDAFEAFWLHDDQVTIDSQGWVINHEGHYGNQEVRILTKTGQPGDDGAFAEIVALFAAAGLSDIYNATHEAKGTARIALLCKAVQDKSVLEVYPNGPPSLAATVRMCRVYDWRDPDQDLMDPATWKWSANAHVNHVHWEWCLRHLPMIGGNGVGWIQGHGPGGSAEPPPARCLQDWTFDHAPRLAERTIAADLCDERVPLKAGGDEARYEQHGWWEIGTEQADIRDAFMRTYDGWMAEGADGSLIMKGGRYDAPPSSAVLTDRHLVEANWNRGAADKDTRNILKANFTSVAHAYSTQAVDDWRDEDLIALLGEKPSDTLDLGWVHSHAQARRLLKRMAPRAFAQRHGDLAADLDGLNHIARRYGRLVRKTGPASMRDVHYELLGASIDLASGRVPLSIVRADPNVDAWNPVTEEGIGPSLTERAPPVQVPLPIVVSVEPVTVPVGGGVNGVRLRIVIEDPERPGLTFAIRTRQEGDPSWVEENPQSAVAVSGGLQIESAPVPAGALEYSVSAWSGGFNSGWTDASDVDAEPAVAVPAPSNLTASSPSAGTLRVGYRDPAQPVAYCIVRTNTSASLTGATGTPERPPAGVYTPQSVDLTRAAGTYYVWVTAYDEDDNPSADLGPAGPVTVG